MRIKVSAKNRKTSVGIIRSEENIDKGLVLKQVTPEMGRDYGFQSCGSSKRRNREGW